MNRAGALPLLALLVLLPPSPSRAAAEDLAVNGGFEKGLDGWRTSNPSGAFQATADAKVRKAGRASAHLVKSGGSRIMADGLSLEIPKVPAGAKVAVSAQVRGKGMKNGWLKFQVYDASGEQVLDEVSVNDSPFRGDFDWTAAKREFEIPPTAIRAELALYLYLDGEAWLDEVSILALGKGAPPKKESVKPLDAATKKWLDAHAVKLESLAFRGSLADLAPLKEVLKDARIVQLGESSHGDGAAFAAKSRLARFLHEEMGFEVLAFESGLFECDRANELLRKGEAAEAMAASIFGIWRTGQVRPIFDYMSEKARSEKPLLLAGFDCRASSNLARTLWDRLAEFLSAAEPPAEADLEVVRRLEELLESQGDSYKPPEKELQAGLLALERIRAALKSSREALVRKHGEAETAFFERCLGNWAARESFERSKSDPSLGIHLSGNLRDAAMAENLRWLAEVRHPGKKIVCWAATFHLARGLQGVEMGGNSKFYDGCRNMGQATHEAFGKACYTIGFCASGGKAGIVGKTPYTLDAPREGSVEDLLHRYGTPFLFTDLRGEGPFSRRMRMSPLSHVRNIEARWPDVMDGVFFIDEMTPAK